MITLAAVSFVVAVVTKQHPTTIKAYTRIACTLLTPVDSTKEKAGDTFELRVTDPSQPSLRDAKIVGHITNVTPPRGALRASISFLFDTITYGNGLKEPIRAFVISPNVTNRTSGTPMPVAVPPAPFAASPSTIVWQTQLGSKTVPSAQTGGHAYASKSGMPIVAPAGTAVTLELASDLHTP